MTGSAWGGTILISAALGALSFFVAGRMTGPVAQGLFRGGVSARNYAGRLIPTGVGVVLPLTALAVMPAALAFGLSPVRLSAWFVVLLGMGMLGLLDDTAGDRSQRGLAGHLRALRSGRPTTGTAKAIFGALIALYAAWQLHRHAGLALLSGGVIALAANAVNLLDVRPGRAIKGFMLLVGAGWITLLAAPLHPLARDHALLTAAAVGAAFALVRPDLDERLMLGDAGSNAFGAAAGLWLSSAPWQWQALFLLALLLLHGYAESRSISDAIERIPLLGRIDRWGRSNPKRR